VKGRSALSYLSGLPDGRERRAIVVDTDPLSIESAVAAELPAIHGDATESDTLRAAGVEDAATVIVAAHRDDTNVLIVLRARELNPRATIIAACREESNSSLLRRSGANMVIVSADSAGRLLGMSAATPAAAHVIDDLLRSGTGLDVVERRYGPGEPGLGDKEQPVAVRRGDELLAYEPGMELAPDDSLVCVRHVGRRIEGDAGATA